MDSITQAVLGASVAHACWHKPLGRWSIAWGLGLGTLPDLDIIAYPFLDKVQQLYWHRGESHALWFIILLTFLLTPLVCRIHRNADPPMTRRTAFLGLWLIFSSHVLVDVFTVYGTQLLAPFSRFGFSLGNLFIIDPLFTLPMLVGILAVILVPPAWRARVNRTGLTLACLYAGWSCVAQARAHQVFEQALDDLDVVTHPGRSITAAAPLNTLLWRHLAEVEDGFLVGYWSWLDGDRDVFFTYVPRQAAQVRHLRQTRAFAVVDWFSQGYWAAFPEEGRIRVMDLRFNEVKPRAMAPPYHWSGPFSWAFPERGHPVDEPDLILLPMTIDSRGDGFSRLWQRMLGDEDAW